MLILFFSSQNLFFLGVLFSKLPFINLWVIWGNYNLRTNRVNLFFYENRQKIKTKGKNVSLQSLECAIRVCVYQNTVWNRNLFIKKIRQLWIVNFFCLIYLTGKCKFHWFSLTTTLYCQIQAVLKAVLHQFMYTKIFSCHQFILFSSDQGQLCK